MERQIITVDSEGQLILSAEVSAALGLEPGSAWEISVEEKKILLHPALPDPVVALRGMFKPGPSLEDDLMEWRRSEKW